MNKITNKEAITRFKNEFYALVAKNSPYLPEIGCFNVYLIDGEANSFETQGDKPSEQYSWADFCDWLVDDIKELAESEGVEFKDLMVTDIQYAGMENMCND